MSWRPKTASRDTRADVEALDRADARLESHCRRASALTPQPAGTGPTRLGAIIPPWPALPPPVKLNASCADVQLVNVTVALPTALLACVIGVGVSNTPPIVSYISEGVASTRACGH